MQKNQKRSMHWLLIIPGKPHFGPILGHFGPKTSKQGCRNFMLKIRKNPHKALLYLFNMTEPVLIYK